MFFDFFQFHEIQQLKLFQDLGISGMTGILTLDQQDKIKRKFIWASFQNGIPQLTSAGKEN